MSVIKIIAELPKLSEADWRRVLRKLLEPEDLPLSAANEELVAARLAAHHANPNSSLPLEEMKRRRRAEA